jgi:hypothetical protein
VASAIRLAKGHVRYAVHRPNEHGRRQYRELWDRDGRISRQTAYERLDDARPADYVYRLTLSPHPEHQDLNRRLDLQAWTRGMMRQLERAPTCVNCAPDRLAMAFRPPTAWYSAAMVVTGCSSDPFLSSASWAACSSSVAHARARACSR